MPLLKATATIISEPKTTIEDMFKHHNNVEIKKSGDLPIVHLSAYNKKDFRGIRFDSKLFASYAVPECDAHRGFCVYVMHNKDARVGRVKVGISLVPKQREGTFAPAAFTRVVYVYPLPPHYSASAAESIEKKVQKYLQECGFLADDHFNTDEPPHSKRRRTELFNCDVSVAIKAVETYAPAYTENRVDLRIAHLYAVTARTDQ